MVKDEELMEIEKDLMDLFQKATENPIQTIEEYSLLLKDLKVDMVLHLDSFIEMLRGHPNKKLVKFFIKRRVKLLRWLDSLLRTEVGSPKHFQLLKKIVSSIFFMFFILKKMEKDEV